VLPKHQVKAVIVENTFLSLANRIDFIVVSTSNTKDENPKNWSLATRIGLLNYIITGEEVGVETERVK
jgi:hypothetical protein